MIYLDNSATTQVDQDVAGTACEVMTEVYGNPSSPYLLGRDALGRLTAARQQVAQVIGAPTRQIFFTSGGTEANNLAIRGSVLAARAEGRNKNYHHCHRTFFCPGILQVTGGRRIRGGIHPSQGREDTGR